MNDGFDPRLGRHIVEPVDRPHAIVEQAAGLAHVAGQDDDALPVVEQPVHERGADEAGAAGDQHGGCAARSPAARACRPAHFVRSRASPRRLRK